ncbi:MAG: hypothetical protein N4A33_01250 [Bacteriovoracaceae bacterium]|nr:hypothetical protein [Bacteriovoracaceae bacterium]
MHKHLILILSLISFSTFTQSLTYQDLSLSDNITESHTKDRFKLMFVGSYFQMSNDEVGTDLSGFGASFQAIYALNKKLGVGGGAGTAMSGSGAGALTVLNWAFTWALTGNLNSSRSTYSLNGREVLKASNSIAQGLRVQALLSQYYFNASANTIPYAGLGVMLYYDYFFESLGLNAVAGIRMDQLFNNEVSITPMTVNFGILF